MLRRRPKGPGFWELWPSQKREDFAKAPEGAKFRTRRPPSVKRITKMDFRAVVAPGKGSLLQARTTSAAVEKTSGETPGEIPRQTPNARRSRGWTCSNSNFQTAATAIIANRVQMSTG
jgi:hypothetical protein